MTEVEFILFGKLRRSVCWERVYDGLELRHRKFLSVHAIVNLIDSGNDSEGL